MSKFTKFLALALATLMVAGMMVFTAPAAAAYEPTGDYASDIALLNALDVMLGDGVSFNEKAPVTRWQMALFIARIVTGETGNEMWEAEKSAYYTDVDATDYPGAIDFCYDMGYMNGVGDNQFNPDGNIIYQDALTLIVRLLGYETKDTKYPWGHILAAQSIDNNKGDFLTDKIDAGYRDDLLREEVANLIATAIFVPVLDAKGEEGKTLMASGLKAEALKDATLVATYNAAIEGNDPTGDITKVTIKFLDNIDQDEDLETVYETIDVKNLTYDSKYHINDLLGFKASLISLEVKREVVYFADMYNVTVVDAYEDKEFQLKDSKFLVGKTEYKAGATFLKYGADAKNVFVTADIATDVPTTGRAIICNVGNDNNTANDVVRFVAFDQTTAIYAADGTFGDDNSIKAIGGKKGDATTFYYEPKSGYEAKVYTSANKSASLVRGVNTDVNLEAYYLGNGVGKGTGTTVRTEWGSNSYLSSALYVAVVGDLVSGQICLNDITIIGNLSFVNVGKAVEVVTGTGDFTSVNGDGEFVIGGTAFEYGYAYDHNDWVVEGDDFDDELIGEKVNYTTANGVIIAIEAWEEKPEDPTYNSPYTTDYFVIDYACQYDELGKLVGDNVTVNADGTITFTVFNTKTLENETITVSQINGVKLGALINTFGITTASDMFKDHATGATVEELLLNLVTTAGTDYTLTNDNDKYAVALVAVANNVEGVYDIVTNAFKPEAFTALKKDYVNDVTLTFNKYGTSALSNEKYTIETGWKTDKNEPKTAAKYLTVTAATKLVLIGANGIETVTGVVPTEGDAIYVERDDVLVFSNDLIVVYNTAATVDGKTVFKIAEAEVETPKAETTYFTLSWKTTYAGVVAKETQAGKRYYEYSFKNVYNVVENKYEDIAVVSATYVEYDSFFGGVWAGTNSPIAAENLTDGKLNEGAQTNLYTVFAITGNEVKAAKQADFVAALEGSAVTVTKVDKNNANTLEAGDIKSVLSYTFDLYQVAKGDKADNIQAGVLNTALNDDLVKALTNAEAVLVKELDDDDKWTGKVHFIVGLTFAE